jgi:DNA repair protein RecN (Recombination protein N)
MLVQLQIQNYAIIDALTVQFAPGLNIITGETGAGKSILMGALGLVLGNRADSSVLMDSNAKCMVEAVFAPATAAAVQQLLTDYELDSAEELVLRREIGANGKSRAFVNDTPVNLTQLKSLTALLVDLHQQFDTLELGEDLFQQQVLDTLAGNMALLQSYAQAYQQYLALQQRLQSLLQQQTDAKREQDYYQFLCEELEAAALGENELEELDAELKLLANAESVQQQLQAVCYELNDSEQPLVHQLKVLVNKLQSASQYLPILPTLTERLLAAQIEIKDISAELEQLASGIQYSPQRMQEVNDKMALGHKLLKKHGVSTTAELLAIQADLRQKLSAAVELDDTIARQQQQLAQSLSQCQQLAGKLRQHRQKAAGPLAQQVNQLLAKVGMPNAALQVSLQPGELNRYGSDQIAFLFDANKSGRLEPLHKVASGGELSRLMLCIKSLVARQLQLPTLIFDEIDSGISGEAARQVGQIMQDLGQGHQVIAITHQPQIAARAHAHYLVHKATQHNKVTTGIRLLDKEERVTTIAQMLSGEKPTAAALENAREMVGN